MENPSYKVLSQDFIAESITIEIRGKTVKIYRNTSYKFYHAHCEGREIAIGQRRLSSHVKAIDLALRVNEKLGRA